MKKIAVLTGAGISQESGISTFRDSDGLWENYRIEDVANYDSWEKNPQLVRDFYNQRRKQYMDCKPNEGHKQLVRLEEENQVFVITQNVDNLHEMAGSSNVIHLHGEINKACSVDDNNEVYPIKGWELKAEDVDRNGKPLRPFIVFFGEAVPMIEKAAEICSEADIIIIVGTSMVVYPAAGLISYAKRGCKIYVVDPKKPDINLKNIEFIQEKAGTGVKQVVDKILSIK